MELDLVMKNSNYTNIKLLLLLKSSCIRSLLIEIGKGCLSVYRMGLLLKNLEIFSWNPFLLTAV